MRRVFVEPKPETIQYEVVRNRTSVAKPIGTLIVANTKVVTAEMRKKK